MDMFTKTSGKPDDLVLLLKGGEHRRSPIQAE
jgi:hypothetical protein